MSRIITFERIPWRGVLSAIKYTHFHTHIIIITCLAKYEAFHGAGVSMEAVDYIAMVVSRGLRHGQSQQVSIMRP